MSHHRDIVVVKRSRQIVDQRLQNFIRDLIFDRAHAEHKIMEILVQHIAIPPQPAPAPAVSRKNPRDTSSDDVPLGDDLPKRYRTTTCDFFPPPASLSVPDHEIQDAPVALTPTPSAPLFSDLLEDWTVHQVDDWSYRPTDDFEYQFDPSIGLSRLSLSDSEDQSDPSIGLSRLSLGEDVPTVTPPHYGLDEKHTDENEEDQDYDPDDLPSYEERAASSSNLIYECENLYELEYTIKQGTKDALERRERLQKRKSDRLLEPWNAPCKKILSETSK